MGRWLTEGLLSRGGVHAMAFGDGLREKCLVCSVLVSNGRGGDAGPVS
jgi:hypothetical protein